MLNFKGGSQSFTVSLLNLGIPFAHFPVLLLPLEQIKSQMSFRELRYKLLSSPSPSTGN